MTSISQLHLPELNKNIPSCKPFPKSVLWNFYSRFERDLSEQSFRRILYALEKRQVLTPIGAGMYSLIQADESRSKSAFVPVWSLAHNQVREITHAAFPYLEVLSWETSLLHDWMIHQPANNQIILGRF